MARSDKPVLRRRSKRSARGPGHNVRGGAWYSVRVCLCALRLSHAWPVAWRGIRGLGCGCRLPGRHRRNLKPKPPLAVAPFDAKQANAHQEAWPSTSASVSRSPNSIGIKLRLIPPGEFLMGSSAQQIEPFLNREVLPWPKRWIESEVPQKRVVLREPFYLACTR